MSADVELLGREIRKVGRTSPWRDRLARIGLAAKGVSFGLVAVLSIGVALGKGGKTTDRQGALATLAGHLWGEVVLVLLAIGFAGYAIWRLADAAFDSRDDGSDAKGLAKRAGYLARAAIYAALCATTVSLLVGSGGGGHSEKQTTSGVLGWPGGRWLVLAVAAAIAGAAAWNAYRGLTTKFEERLETGRMSEGMRKLAKTLGAVGHVARGIVFGIVAWFLAKAAIQYDAKEAVGLDGALARLVREPYGRALLGVVAAGLLAYGAYCLVEARYRKI
ncbi:MAG: hypothetical protein QOE36_3681 [Gaiellaceae bacterium]|nr:hypothetical protein [Gaiellaceae bacterium]